MLKQRLSPNAAHAQNVHVLSAAIELGTAAILECLGTDEASNQVGGVQLTTPEIQTALTARLAKNLGV
jgi:hypothetical protein